MHNKHHHAQSLSTSINPMATIKKQQSIQQQSPEEDLHYKTFYIPTTQYKKQSQEEKNRMEEEKKRQEQQKKLQEKETEFVQYFVFLQSFLQRTE